MQAVALTCCGLVHIINSFEMKGKTTYERYRPYNEYDAQYENPGPKLVVLGKLRDLRGGQL